IASDGSQSRRGVKAGGVARDLEIGAFNRRSLRRTEDTRIQVQHGVCHRDLKIDLIVLRVSGDVQLTKLHVVLIDASRSASDEPTAQMSIFINIGQDESFCFMADGEGNLAG